MLIIKTIYRLVVISSLVSLVGCAFGTRNVYLGNTEIKKDPSLPARIHPICFDSLSDERPDTLIGHVQNGYGMRTAKVVSVHSVSKWINKEIENRLISAGYEVRKGCQEDSSSFIIDGKILKVYTTAFMTYLGQVSINASIRLKNDKLIEKEYTGHKKAGINWAASAESFRSVLLNSLDIVMTKFIRDIDSLDNINSITIQNQSTAEQTDLNKEQEISDTINHDLLIDNDTLKCPQNAGAPTIISGMRSLSSIKFAMDSIKASLNSLYRDRFELDTTLSGSICFYFEIGAEGKVRNISIFKNSLNDKPIEEKLVSLLKKRKFKKLENSEDSTRIIYQLLFTKHSAKASKKGAIAALVLIGCLVPVIFSVISLTRNPVLQY